MGITDNEEMDFFLTSGSYVYHLVSVIKGFCWLFYSKLKYTLVLISFYFWSIGGLVTKKMTSSLCYYGILLLYDVYIFHVAVGLYSKRSKKTSICGQNISDKFNYHIMTSSVICDWTDARGVIIIDNEKLE